MSGRTTKTINYGSFSIAYRHSNIVRTSMIKAMSRSLNDLTPQTAANPKPSKKVEDVATVSGYIGDGGIQF